MYVHLHKKFDVNQTKIKGGCQSGRKVVSNNSKSDLPLVNLNGSAIFANNLNIILLNELLSMTFVEISLV